MAGARIEVSLDTRDASAAIGRLVALGGNLTPLLRSIGEGVRDTTQLRFDSGTDPAGLRWVPLNPVYAAAKRGAGILKERAMVGGLQGSITYQVQGPTSVLIGTNKPYAAIHQFGGVIKPQRAKSLVFRLGGRTVRAKQVKIPARPYLGIGAADREVIEEMVALTLRRTLSGGS